MGNTSVKVPGVPESADAVISSAAKEKDFDKKTLRRELRVRGDNPARDADPKPRFGNE